MRRLVMMLWVMTMGCASETPLVEQAPTEQESEQTPAPGNSYIACGCGCCVGPEPEVRCLAEGETLQSIIAKDKENAASPNCPFAGCSFPVKYMDCSATPPAP